MFRHFDANNDIFRRDYVRPKRTTNKKDLLVGGLGEFLDGLPMNYAGKKRKRCSVQFIAPEDRDRIKLEAY